jgi:hypothetical protein
MSDFANSGFSGTNVTIFAKKLAVLTQNKAKYAKI